MSTNVNPQAVPAGSPVPYQFWVGEWDEYGIYYPEHSDGYDTYPAHVMKCGSTGDGAYIARVMKRGANPGTAPHEWPGHGILVKRRVTQSLWEETEMPPLS